MKKSFLLYFLVGMTFVNSVRAEFKYLQGTGYVEWSDTNVDVTDNGDGTYSFVNGMWTNTGRIHNGVFVVETSSSSYQSYTYEYAPNTWQPTKTTQYDNGGRKEYETTYQIDGNVMTSNKTSYVYDSTGMTIYTHTDNYDPFKHNETKYTYSENCWYGSCTEDKYMSDPTSGAYMIVNSSQISYSGNGTSTSIMIGTNGPTSWDSFGSGGFGYGSYQYDPQTGKLLSKRDDNTGTIVESYTVNDDGSITVYSGNKNNGGSLIGTFSSFEEYIASSLGENFLDILDSDFGRVGYVPSRLQSSGSSTLSEKQSDGSIKMTDSNGNVYYKGKRIYTIKEANEVSGKKNKVTIRYK